jgi:hypothetical protein
MIFDGGSYEPGMGREGTGRDRFGRCTAQQGSVTLLDRLADKPTASIPHACDGWAETQAAYRFLAQEDIGWEDILSPHFGCTQQRMQGRPVVLCIQDTTELDFNGQQTEGLGALSFAAQRGMYLHPTYAVSPEREPLGVLDAWGCGCGMRQRRPVAACPPAPGKAAAGWNGMPAWQSKPACCQRCAWCTLPTEKATSST